MQLKSRYHEQRAYLSLRPSNYIAGRLFRFAGKAAYIPRLGYVVNDANVTRELLQDTEHFSLNEAGGLGALIGELWGKTPTLLSMEGDVHKKVKFTLLELFKEESLAKTALPRMKKEVARIVKDLHDGQEVDIAEFTRIFTNRMTSLMLGVDKTDDAEMQKLSELVTLTMDVFDLRYMGLQNENHSKAKEYVLRWKTIAKEYYNDPHLREGSIISLLKKLGYGEEKTLGFISMFIVAGNVTLSSTFPRLVAIMHDTGSWDKLKKQPELLESTIQEALRYITPGPILLHGVKKSTSLSGYDFKEHRKVMVLLYNIMHDVRRVKKPMEFDISRKLDPELRGLWFGVGPHFCIGSVLAQLELRTLLTCFMNLEADIKINKRAYKKMGIYPGYEHLFIQLQK